MKDKQQLLCFVRKEWAAATPEEIIRQRLLHQMVEILGYPLSHLVLEKELGQLPHLQGIASNLPVRRTDIVCFGKGIHPLHDLYPLLVIECKAVAITPKAFNQVIGYNYYVQAPYVALANLEEVHTGWYDHTKKEYSFRKGLPFYSELIDNIIIK